jgi:pyrimidine-nucleoside phosphorylase
MSKKLAEGIGALVLDIKFGSGAFMKTAEQAEVLARKLMAIGHAHGKGVVSWITNMDQPLGRFIGNAVEIGECVAILKNERYWGHSADEFDDTRELSLRLAAEMIYLGRQTPSAEAGYARAKELLASGAAWSKFESLCRLQGGELEKLSEPHVVCTVAAPSDGCVSTYATEAIGIAAITIGAGRAKASDVIDPSAGIFVHKKLGESVVRGEPLFTLFGNPHANSQVGSPVGSKVDSPIAAQMIDDRFEQASEMLLAATTISLQKSRVPDLMTKRIELL